MLVRVRLPGGVVSAAGLVALAEVADHWGSSVIELTARANVQLRGIHPDAVAPAAHALIDAGLAHADPSRDGRRDVIGPPLAGHDPHAIAYAYATPDIAPGIAALIARISSERAAADDLAGLPPKFCVVVDDGGRHGVRAVPADIAFGAVRSADGRVLVEVVCGRALDPPGGHRPPTVTIDPHEVAATACAAAQVAALIAFS